MPSAEAVKPKMRKTVDKPSTKNNAGKNTETGLSLFVASATEIPLIYARYGGTIGSTQGLKKEMMPAKNARLRAGIKVASMISIPNMITT